MRFNRLLHLIAFPGKAHGRPPAFGFVKTKMPDSPAPSQVTSTTDFSRYIPLSAGEGSVYLDEPDGQDYWVWWLVIARSVATWQSR